MAKNRFRLTVAIDISDANLWCWKDVARHFGVTSEFYAYVNAKGGGGASQWWVYCNRPIPPSAILKVEDLYHGG